MSAVLLAASASATTILDLVGQRIEGNYAAIDQFVGTANPYILKQQLIVEIEELETKLLELEELHQSDTITDKTEKRVETRVLSAVREV